MSRARGTAGISARTRDQRRRHQHCLYAGAAVDGGCAAPYAHGGAPAAVPTMGGGPHRASSVRRRTCPDPNPPPRTLLRTALYGWCTAARPRRRCALCYEIEAGRQQHYVECGVARAFGARRLALAEWPGGEATTAQVIRAIGAGGPARMHAAMCLDAVLSAVDGARHGALQTAFGAMAARLKEVVHRHAQCRVALPRAQAG